MRYVFLNSPVQNGDFTFSGRPGKVVGIRIASALNHLLGSKPMPHLWNTISLSGDLRYRQSMPEPQRVRLSRAEFDAGIIAAKYDQESARGGVATDTDDDVRNLALEMITSLLRNGTLKVSLQEILECAHCGHMKGVINYPCRACGCTGSRSRTLRHLVTERKLNEPALDANRLHAQQRRPPRHLLSIAANVPACLILSRTRDYGMSLDPLGLPGLVLDPRVSLHLAVLAVALRHNADWAIMTITQNAAANIAAYGRNFLDHDGLRLGYAIHGHVPYHAIPRLYDGFGEEWMDEAARDQFERWFLPLYSLREKSDLQAGQLPAVARYFRRAWLMSGNDAAPDLVRYLRQSVQCGSTEWIMQRNALATAIAVART